MPAGIKGAQVREDTLENRHIAPNAEIAQSKISQGSGWITDSLGGNYRGNVETGDDLPLTGNTDGDIRFVEARSEFYYWDAVAMEWQAASFSGNISNTVREDQVVPTGPAQSVFTLSNEYVPNADNLRVYKNGLLMRRGASNDYVETDKNTVTFNYTLEAGDDLSFIIGNPLNNFFGQIDTFTATASQTIFDLSFTYKPGNLEIDVFKNGLLMVAGSLNDYVETDSDTITFNSALIAGDRVVVRKARDYTQGGFQGDNLPIGTVVMYNGTGIADAETRTEAIGSRTGDTVDLPGWYVCNGYSNTPDLIDKFVRGSATSGVTGGSDDAIVVEHQHDVKLTGDIQAWQQTGGSGVGYTFDVDGVDDGTRQFYSDSTGSSGADKNIPAYYSVIFIIKLADWITPAPDEVVVSSFMRTLLDDTSPVAARQTLGLDFPQGTVLMYNGTGIDSADTRTEQIGDRTGDTVFMKGWYVCNGQSGTPNLIDKFIRSMTSSGTTGGSDDAYDHDHYMGVGWDDNNTVFHVGDNPKYGSQVASGVHHSSSINNASSGAYREARTDTMRVAGTDANMPAYYSLIFIIKLTDTYPEIEEKQVSAFAETLLDDADASEARSTLNAAAKNKIANSAEDTYHEITTESLDDTNLVAHWKMNDNAANNVVTDETGNHDGGYKDGGGDLNTSTGSTTGKINQALDFDGTDEYVQIPDHADFTIDDDFTACLWFKIDAVGATHDHIFGNGGSYIDPGFAINIIDNSGDPVIQGEIADGIDQLIAQSNGSVYDDSNWHHVALCWDHSEKKLFLVLDGVPVSSDTDANIDASINPGNAIGVGYGLHPSYGGDHFDGQVDDIRYYNTLLSINQIQAIYNSGNGTEDSSVAVDIQKVVVDGTEVGNVSNSGIWNMPKQVGCSVYLSGNQTVSHATPEIAEFDTVDWQVNCIFNTQEHIFVVPEDGIYMVTANISFTDMTDPCKWGGRIVQNGVNQVTTETRQTGGNGETTTSKLLKCSAGDSIRLDVYHNSGTDESLVGGNKQNTSMSICKVA